jgi:hypothetical protein
VCEKKELMRTVKVDFVEIRRFGRRKSGEMSDRILGEFGRFVESQD